MGCGGGRSGVRCRRSPNAKASAGRRKSVVGEQREDTASLSDSSIWSLQWRCYAIPSVLVGRARGRWSLAQDCSPGAQQRGGRQVIEAGAVGGGEGSHQGRCSTLSRYSIGSHEGRRTPAAHTAAAPALTHSIVLSLLTKLDLGEPASNT